MDLLRNLFGNVASGVVRLAVTGGILFLTYLFLVKPVIETTNEAIKASGVQEIGRSLDGLAPQVKRQVRRSFQTAKRQGGNPRRLLHCVQRAGGNVHRIQRCVRSY